jgi:hypothetical protein
MRLLPKWMRLNHRRLADLDDADKAALAQMLRDTIGADRVPLSPRGVKSLKATLDELDPPAPLPKPKPKPTGDRSMALVKKRRR